MAKVRKKTRMPAWRPRKRPRVTFSSAFKKMEKMLEEKQLDLFLKPEDISFQLGDLKLSSAIGSQIEELIAAVSLKKAGTEPILRDFPLAAIFHGPSGTGKTSAAKAIAKHLNKKILVTTAGDILSCWVSGTEEKIRSWFKNASDNDAVLFIDEAEGLFRGRENAQRNWEVTQVNEFLRQVEEFKGILIAATNFKGMIDPAFTRRFPFKVEFDLPNGRAAVEIWATYLKKANLPVQWSSLLGTNCKFSPGDIKNIVTKACLKRVKSIDEIQNLICVEREFSAGPNRTIGLRPEL